jgi:hypothetical protein
VADLSTADPVTIRVNRFAERRAQRASQLADGQRTALAGVIHPQPQLRSIIKGANDIGAAAAQDKITGPKQSSKGFGDAKGKAAKGLVSRVRR